VTATATRELLGWEPTGPSLLDDLEAGLPPSVNGARLSLREGTARLNVARTSSLDAVAVRQRHVTQERR
jgi:hypothetical protein